MAPYKKRRRFDRAFKIEAVRLANESGRTAKSVADDLGIHPVMLSRWRREFSYNQENAFSGNGNLTPQEAEIKDLKRRLRDVTEERDILKKAVAFFAKHPK